MWFNSLMGKIRTAGPEMKTGYLAGASLQAHCVDVKLIVCLAVRSGESTRLSLVGRRRAKEGRLRTPSVPLTIFLNQCLCKCEIDDPRNPMFFSGKRMNFLFSFKSRSHGL